MNFSKIHYRSFLGRLLRAPLRLIPRRMSLPILQGPIKGKKWIVGAGEHGYWLGSYELEKRKAFSKAVQPGDVVYDIGANVGYFSLLASVLTGEEGKVYAFEPLQRNVYFIRRHLELNRLTNVEVIESAVANQPGEAFFDTGASTAMGHLAAAGEVKVKVVTLDQLIAEGRITPPQIIKVDVEGAESLVMQGARQLLMTYRPKIFLDTHGREAHQATVDLLQQMGYAFTCLDGKDMIESKELIALPAD